LITLFLAYLLSGCGGSDVNTDPINPNPVTCGDDNNIYVRTDGDDTNPGTLAQPLRTIQAAVDCGQAGQAIRVANGTYETSIDEGVISLSEGQSMYGGYSSDYQTRSPEVYPTIINDVTDMSVLDNQASCTIYIESDIISSTVVDGIEINGTVVGDGGKVRALCISGSPRINNNIIEGGGNFGADESLSIDIISGSPSIINNTISGGRAQNNSWGIKSRSEDPITISNNKIIGRTLISKFVATNTYGIEITALNTGGSSISNNQINGGGGLEKTVGISIDASSVAVIESNTIEAGANAAFDSLGYGIYTKNGTPVIRNNTIIMSGADAYGIYNISVGNIYNNTIVKGGSDNSWGIYTGAQSADIQNNIVSLTAGICIAEADVFSNPSSLKNNDLYGCVILYRNQNPPGDLINIDDINNLDDIDATDNISVPPVLDIAQDYHLTAESPIEVTQGGMDLSSVFDTDKAGATRTPPWSIGAYEYD
jgi:hypothetical protein